MEIGRDVSIVWLNCLAMICVVPFGLAFFFAIIGLRRLRQLAKRHLPAAQEKAQSLADATETASQKLAAPVIGLQVKGTQIGSAIHAILRRKDV